MPTARQQLVTELQTAGFRTDSTNTDGRYVDGVVYVLADSYASTDLESTLTVIAAMGIGQPIDEYAEQVWAAIRATGSFVPRSMNFQYGDEPLPGRELPPADYVEIDVVSGVIF